MNRYRMLLEESKDAVAIVKKNGDLVDVNQAWLDLFGYERKDIACLNVTKFYVDPSERSMFLQHVPKNKPLKDYELMLRKKDGTIITCLVTSRMKTISNRGLVAYLNILRDITEQKLAQECLAQRQMALEAVYEMATSPDATFETVCKQVAKKVCQLLYASLVVILCAEDDGFRLMAAAVDGELPREIITPQQFYQNSISKCLDDRDYALELCEPLFAKSVGEKGTAGSLLQIPIKNRAGGLVGAIIVIDRSERKFTELDLHLIETLSRYIEQEIERNVMKDRLRYDYQMKMLGQVAVGVAHEVRNPLSAVLAITEALCQDLAQSPQYDVHLYHIRTQLDRVSRLMFDLLNFGRPLDSSSLKRESLVSTVMSAADLWKRSRLTRPSPKVIVRRLQKSDISIQADGAKIQQVLLNLLNNAEEASPTESEIVITISKPKEKMVRVSISDKGCGIKPSSLLRIFDPFVTFKKGGTGLGLSIARNIIEAHNGKISARNNEPPPGCTVEFILPILDKSQS